MAAKYVTGITALNYRLPEVQLGIDELTRAGALTSDSAFLSDLGFESCRQHQESDSFEDVILQCGRELLEEATIRPEDIGWLFKYSGIRQGTETSSGCRGDGSKNVLDYFTYPAGRALDVFGLPQASSVAVSEQGCCGFLSTLRMADAMLQVGDSEAAICIAGDALPRQSGREILYNVMSDAACAVLLQKNASRNKLLAFRQQTQAYYWDTQRRQNELLAAYFPVAARTIIRTLSEAGLTVDDIDWVVPHNVSRKSWEILAGLLGLNMTRIWTDNIARVGHTVSCDHIINLKDMEAAGVLQPGDNLLLFTFGFGATWSCMILEH